MGDYQSLLGVLSLTMGVSWASGVNLYAGLLVLGLGGATGNIELPSDLEVLTNPFVIGAAGLMYATEFFADKIPGVDTTWDALHTFIRIPAGAMLAAGAIGDVSPALEIAAGIVGGGLATTSHATKAGTRLAVNTSPEPFSNWGLSVAEDVAVIGGIWTAVTDPVIFIGLLLVFILLAIWLLPRIWAGAKFIFYKLGQLLGWVDASSQKNAGIEPKKVIKAKGVLAAGPLSADHRGIAEELEKLKRLQDTGAISEDEYETLKKKLIEK